jgi:hypothetical protein
MFKQPDKASGVLETLTWPFEVSSIESTVKLWSFCNRFGDWPQTLRQQGPNTEDSDIRPS